MAWWVHFAADISGKAWSGDCTVWLSPRHACKAWPVAILCGCLRDTSVSPWPGDCTVWLSQEHVCNAWPGHRTMRLSQGHGGLWHVCIVCYSTPRDYYWIDTGVEKENRVVVVRRERMERELGVDEEGWQESPWDLPYVSTGKKLPRSLFMRGLFRTTCVYTHTGTHTLTYINTCLGTNLA